jgi:hypothetical protein
MKIEAGKYYRTRDGQKVGPMRETPKEWGINDLWKWTSVDKKPDTYGFGVWCTDGFSHVDPIVEEVADLTAITTPFGLLDRDTQEALKAHGGPWEHLSACGVWCHTEMCGNTPGYVYRVKPAPPKPREWWLCGELTAGSYMQALDFRDRHNAHHLEIIHVREVLPNQP